MMEPQTPFTSGGRQGLLAIRVKPDELGAIPGFTDNQKLVTESRKEALKKLLGNLKHGSKADSDAMISVDTKEAGTKIAEKTDILKTAVSVGEAGIGNEKCAGFGTKTIIVIDENEPTVDIVKQGKKACGSSVLITPSSMAIKSEIARRKSSREKRTVRLFSPGQDGQGNQKRTKLGIKKGGRAKTQDSGKWEKASFKSYVNASFESKGYGTGARSIPESDKRELENKGDLGTKLFSGDFKSRMTEEIKKQILNGLGDVAKEALQDVHVVEIESIQQCMTTIDDRNLQVADLERPVPQHYAAKVKLMTTVLIPLTVEVAQEQQELHGKMLEVKSQQLGKSAEPEKPQDEVEELSHRLPQKDCTDEAALFDVLDFEYYDFDRDRSEEKFAEGQIWALYDDKDGMPRYYVQISKILNKCPFEVQITWLQPRALSLEAREWSNLGNSLTCGEYDIGEQSTSQHVECFSHVMKPETVQEGRISIHPAKGDVWALYKDGNDRANCDYEIFRVLACSTAAASVIVMPLVKAKGYRTLFIQEAFLHKPQRIPLQKITKFSHQIPVYRLGMEEVPDVLKGRAEICFELDPASTPSCLLDDN